MSRRKRCSDCGKRRKRGVVSGPFGPMACPNEHHDDFDPVWTSKIRLPMMHRAACDCEYPCSCVELDGQRFGSPQDAVEHLATLQAGGAGMIAYERKRQISDEGWSSDHDDIHTDGELAIAAACYATPTPKRFLGESTPIFWPFEETAWKPGPTRIRELVKAGALIAAEIDRLRRLPESTHVPTRDWISEKAIAAAAECCEQDGCLRSDCPKPENADEIDREDAPTSNRMSVWRELGELWYVVQPDSESKVPFVTLDERAAVEAILQGVLDLGGQVDWRVEPWAEVPVPTTRTLDNVRSTWVWWCDTCNGQVREDQVEAHRRYTGHQGHEVEMVDAFAAVRAISNAEAERDEMANEFAEYRKASHARQRTFLARADAAETRAETADTLHTEISVAARELAEALRGGELTGPDGYDLGRAACAYSRMKKLLGLDLSKPAELENWWRNA